MGSTSMECHVRTYIYHQQNEEYIWGWEWITAKDRCYPFENEKGVKPGKSAIKWYLLIQCTMQECIALKEKYAWNSNIKLINLNLVLMYHSLYIWF